MIYPEFLKEHDTIGVTDHQMVLLMKLNLKD